MELDAKSFALEAYRPPEAGSRWRRKFGVDRRTWKVERVYVNDLIFLTTDSGDKDVTGLVAFYTWFEPV